MDKDLFSAMIVIIVSFLILGLIICGIVLGARTIKLEQDDIHNSYIKNENINYDSDCPKCSRLLPKEDKNKADEYREEYLNHIYNHIDGVESVECKMCLAAKYKRLKDSLTTQITED